MHFLVCTHYGSNAPITICFLVFIIGKVCKIIGIKLGNFLNFFLKIVIAARA